MRTIFTFCLLLLLTISTEAQQYYRFMQGYAPYVELSNDQQIVAPDFVNDKLTNLPLDGETFNFFDLDYTIGGVKTFAVQTNGNLRIDNDSSAVIIDGVFTYLDSIDPTTSLSWKAEGDPGKMIIKVQWKNVAIEFGPAGNYVNFQIWVYQESGIIELRYGDRSANNATGYTHSNGPYTGIFYSNDTFNKMYEKTWLYGEPDMIRVDSVQNFTFKRILGLPVSGTIWRFVPKSYTGPITTSIEDKSSDHIVLYPNPAGDVLYLRHVDLNRTVYRLFDLTGKDFETRQISKDQIDLSGLAPGSYILELSTPSGIVRQRFVKSE